MIRKSLRPGSEEVWSSGREAFVCGIWEGLLVILVRELGK
jgi:hypothetical protein